MSAVVDLVDLVPEDVDAVAAGLLNCGYPAASMRYMRVDVHTIEQYNRKETDARESQRSWQSLN